MGGEYIELRRLIEVSRSGSEVTYNEGVRLEPVKDEVEDVWRW